MSKTNDTPTDRDDMSAEYEEVRTSSVELNEDMDANAQPAEKQNASSQEDVPVITPGGDQ
jgi:hypothetical protein